MGYLKDTISGVSWMGGLRGATRVLTFVKIALLARLLSPTEFGLFGISMLVLAFLEIITETGINIFLIQEKAELKEYNDTAWAVSVIRGVGMFFVFFLLARPISMFFNSPEAHAILLLTSVIPLIRGFINPAIVKFQKDLNFNKEFYFRSSIFALDTAVAVLLAFLTRSAISMVWGMIASALVETLYSLFLIKPVPKFALNILKVKKIIGRGKWITLAGIFNYLFENVDDGVVGRLVSTASLGIYQVAYKISSLPLTEIADVVVKVTFPVYVKISGNAKRLKEAFVRTFAVTVALVVPAGIVLYFFTNEIVHVLLGDGWEGVVPIVKVLALFGIIRGVVTATYPFFLALKRQDYVMYVTLSGILGLSLFVIPFVSRYGTLGASYSALIGALFSLPVAFYFISKTFRSLK